jgi:hypothetical protein
LSTLFCFGKLITGSQWLWVMMATAVSYVAANALGQVTLTTAGGTIGWSKNGESKELIVTIWERVKALFSRAFLLCMASIVIASLLLWKGSIDGEVWFALSAALATAYNIGNSVGKL